MLKRESELGWLELESVTRHESGWSGLEKSRAAGAGLRNTTSVVEYYTHTAYPAAITATMGFLGNENSDSGRFCKLKAFMVSFVEVRSVIDNERRETPS